MAPDLGAIKVCGISGNHNQCNRQIFPERIPSHGHCQKYCSSHLEARFVDHLTLYKFAFKNVFKKRQLNMTHINMYLFSLIHLSNI